MTKTLQTFNIIRQRGEPNEVTTIWGWKAYRQEKLFAPEPYNTLIPCLKYDNHFIYEVKDSPETRGIPAFLCTCGANAVLVGIKTYKSDASPEGLVFACMFRNCIVDPKTGELHGHHADGST